MPANRTIFNTLGLILTNAAMTFLLIGILGGDFMAYRTGFFVLAPFILGLTVYITFFLYHQTKRIKKRRIGYLNYSWTLAFVFFNIVLLFFNYLLWLDLFDGKTEMMLA